MKRLQLRTINKIAKKKNVKLVKDKHYFYWVGMNYESAKKLMTKPTTAVFVEHINDLTLDGWMKELQEVL